MTFTLYSTFVWFAILDANRRNYLMKQASSALELDFYTKDKISLRMPVLNFMDKESILTWLEARELILEVGSRFQIRMQTYVTYFLILMIAQLLFIFAVASGLGVKPDVMTIE